VAWGTTIPFYFHGHSALSIGSGAVIYAGPNDVKLNTLDATTQALGSITHTIINFLRYKP